MTEAMTYKSRTVARKDNTIWYGCNANPYVVMMQVENKTEQNGIETATSIRCFLMRTDTTNPVERVVKQMVRTSLYDALDLADYWLRGYGI